MTCLARTGFRRCGTSSPQLSSGPLGGGNIFHSKMERRRTYHKSTLRALARIAYERELKSTLSILAAKFDDWKMGKVTSFEMEELVHKYDCDESRKLWSLYNSTSVHSIVARAVASR